MCIRDRVRTEVYDWAGHCMARERKYAVESESLHRTAGTAELAAVTPPSRIVDGTAYYNTDLTVRLTLRDTFSGLQTVWYTGGTTLSGSRDYAAEAGNDLDGKAERKLIDVYKRQVQQDGTLVRKNVETGLSADNYTEIKSGLEFGDRVVSGGITAGIQEGTRVTPVEG